MEHLDPACCGSSESHMENSENEALKSKGTEDQRQEISAIHKEKWNKLGHFSLRKKWLTEQHNTA